MSKKKILDSIGTDEELAINGKLELKGSYYCSSYGGKLSVKWKPSMDVSYRIYSKIGTISKKIYIKVFQTDAGDGSGITYSFEAKPGDGLVQTSGPSLSPVCMAKVEETFSSLQ